MYNIITSDSFTSNSRIGNTPHLGKLMHWIVPQFDGIPVIVHVDEGTSRKAYHGTITSFDGQQLRIALATDSDDSEHITWTQRIHSRDIIGIHGLPENREQMVRVSLAEDNARDMKRRADETAYEIWQFAWRKLDGIARAIEDHNPDEVRRLRRQYRDLFDLAPGMSSMLTMHMNDAMKGRVAKINRSRETFDIHGRELGHLLRNVPATV